MEQTDRHEPGPTSSARPSAPLTPAEAAAATVTAIAMVGFAAYGFATRSPNTVPYLLTVTLIGIAIRALRDRPLPDLLAYGLAGAAMTHLAGGIVRVGNDVLYNASIGPRVTALHTHLLQYDHYAHAFVTTVATLTIWVLLIPPTADPQLRRRFMLLCGLAALGIGALNEMIEFLATTAHHAAHVGGYDNTGWDLVCNFIGASLGLGVIGSMRGDARPAS